MYYLAYRYDPTKCLDWEGPVANGAIITDEFETAQERHAALAELQADPRIQWAKADDRDLSDATVSGGRL